MSRPNERSTDKMVPFWKAPDKSGAEHYNITVQYASLPWYSATLQEIVIWELFDISFRKSYGKDPV